MIHQLDRTIRLVFTMLASLAGMGWGGFLIWYGQQFDPSTRDMAEAYYSFLIGGALFFVPCFLGFIRAILRFRAPLPRAEQPYESSETVTFDADAAIARYLAERKPEGGAQSLSEPVRHAAPVFGRKIC